MSCRSAIFTFKYAIACEGELFLTDFNRPWHRGGGGGSSSDPAHRRQGAECAGALPAPCHVTPAMNWGGGRARGRHLPSRRGGHVLAESPVPPLPPRRRVTWAAAGLRRRRGCRVARVPGCGRSRGPAGRAEGGREAGRPGGRPGAGRGGRGSSPRPTSPALPDLASPPARPRPAMERRDPWGAAVASRPWAPPGLVSPPHPPTLPPRRGPGLLLRSPGGRWLGGGDAPAPSGLFVSSPPGGPVAAARKWSGPSGAANGGETRPGVGTARRGGRGRGGVSAGTGSFPRPGPHRRGRGRILVAAAVGPGSAFPPPPPQSAPRLTSRGAFPCPEPSLPRPRPGSSSPALPAWAPSRPRVRACPCVRPSPPPPATGLRSRTVGMAPFHGASLPVSKPRDRRVSPHTDTGEWHTERSYPPGGSGGGCLGRAPHPRRVPHPGEQNRGDPRGEEAFGTVPGANGADAFPSLSWWV